MKERQKKAVALKYRKDEDDAPAVTAKGSGAVAEKIIALARKHGVPVRGDRHLAEILSTLELYDEIPLDLYKAAAEILSFLHTARGRL